MLEKRLSISTRCSTLVFSLLLAGTVPAAGAAEPNLSDAEAKALIEEIEHAAEWAEQSLQQLKSDHLDRQVLLDHLDYDPEAIETWVAEQTQWVPYLGRLRGANGVLMDRRGNSLDRSLLLSALLEDAGLETRLVRTELSEESAESLLAKHAGGAVRGVGPELEPSERLRALHAELEAGAGTLARLAGLGEGQDSNMDHTLAAVRDHWWVQAKEGTTWIDLDPLIPKNSAVSRPAPQETFSTPDKVPAGLDHSLTLKVVIERWQAGELFEEVALEHALTPRDAVRGHILEIEFHPFTEAWLDDELDLDLAPHEVAEGAELWQPLLRLDHGEVEYGLWISKAGTLEKDPMRWVADRKMDVVTSAIAALGTAEEAAPESHLTGVWLEYDIRRPGQASRLVRRELADILGVDRRDAEALGGWAIDRQRQLDRGFAMQTNSVALVSIATPQRPALEQAIYRQYTDNRSFHIALVYQAAGWEDERIEPSLATARPYPVDLLAMMTARGLWSRHRDRVYPDEINVWSNHLLWGQGGTSAAGVLATDIVTNHIGALAATGSQARVLRVEEGMLDTFIEQHLSVDSDGPNAYGRFVSRDPVGSEWSGLTLAADKGWPGALPATETVRLATALEDGARVVISDEVAQFEDSRFPYWWQIDPGDGTTLGMGYRGWGAQYTERGVIQVQSKAFDAAQKRGIVTRACKIGEAIVKVSTAVVLVQNPVMIDIAYVIKLEAASLHVTQTSSGISKICG